MDYIRRIQSDHEHQEAIAEVEFLWNAVPGTPDHQRLADLGAMVAEYEERRFGAAFSRPAGGDAF